EHPTLSRMAAMAFMLGAIGESGPYCSRRPWTALPAASSAHCERSADSYWAMPMWSCRHLNQLDRDWMGLRLAAIVRSGLWSVCPGYFTLSIQSCGLTPSIATETDSSP